jgi:hypothetical protein
MRSWWTRVLLVLILVMLTGNLVAFMVGGESLASEEVLYWVLVALGGLAGVVINALGIRLATKCRAKRDRSSYVWMRRGFAIGLLLTLLLCVDVLVGKRLLVKDTLKAGLLMIMLATPAFFFLVSAYREYARVAASHRTGTGSRRRPRSKASSE